jgi:NAD(P)-dependent dehydrogenase (short-subunit alcohol dehydrogenase family)
MELEHKVALITGSTSGIGAEAARLFASQGAEVIITGRQPSRGAQVVSEIEAKGGTARYVDADLADRAAVHGLAEQAGQVDILVNNAAFFPMGPTVDANSEAFDRAMEANVRAPYFLTAAIAPGMMARGRGSIVNVTTMAARLGMPGLSVYSATKAAMESLTRTWAAEFGGSGVRVNSVSPGPTATESVVARWGDDGLDELGRSTILSRTAAPSEIANAILFLAGDRSSYVTGATLAVDGGRTAL